MTDGSEVLAGGERWVSVQTAVQIYGVSRRTLYNWMDKGSVQYALSPGGGRYVLLSSLALRLENGQRIELDVPGGDVPVYEFLDVR